MSARDSRARSSSACGTEHVRRGAARQARFHAGPVNAWSSHPAPPQASPRRPTRARLGNYNMCITVVLCVQGLPFNLLDLVVFKDLASGDKIIPGIKKNHPRDDDALCGVPPYCDDDGLGTGSAGARRMLPPARRTRRPAPATDAVTLGVGTSGTGVRRSHRSAALAAARHTRHAPLAACRPRLTRPDSATALPPRRVRPGSHV